MKRIALALLALLGLAGVLVGIGMRTIWLPPSTVTASVVINDASPIIVTAPGLLEMYPGTATVTVRAQDGGPVFIGRGREQDVTAWLKGAKADSIVGLSAPGVLAVRPGRGETGLPDVRQADIWIDSATQTGEANYVWRDGQGRYQLVITSDGVASAPGRISITWPQGQETPWAMPLLVLGSIFLLVSLVVSLQLFIHSRRAGAKDAGTGLERQEELRAAAEAPTETIPPVTGDTTQSIAPVRAEDPTESLAPVGDGTETVPPVEDRTREFRLADEPAGDEAGQSRDAADHSRDVVGPEEGERS